MTKYEAIRFALQHDANRVFDLEAGASRMAPGLVERAALAAADGWEVERTIKTPVFLSDTGVRKFSDSTEFFNEHLRMYPKSLRGPQNWGDISEDQDGPHDADLVRMLDAMVTFWGDYDGASHIIRHNMSGIHESQDYRLLTYAATVLSGYSPEESEELFQKSVDAARSGPEHFVARLRKSALILKRRREPARAQAEILDALRDLNIGRNATGFSESDGRVLAAMLENLLALTWMKLEVSDKAWHCILSAKARVTSSGLSQVGYSESLRYTTQITGNLAQLAWHLGHANEALEAWRENLSHAISKDHYSFSEALFGYAYGNYLAGEYETAERAIRDSIVCIADEASPGRLKVARKVWSGTMLKLGDRSRSWEILEQAERDPLGLEVESSPAKSVASDYRGYDI